MRDSNRHTTRRRYLKVLGGASAVGLAGRVGARQDDFPSRNLEVVVPWGAGGGTDSMARAISRPAEEMLDVNINVQNRTGANGLNAARYVLNQPADGHTIWAQAAAIAANIALGRTNFGMEEIQPLARTNMDTSWFYTNPDESGIEDVDQLVEQAEGEGVTIGGVGDVGIDPVFTLRWAQLAGVEDGVEYVSYDDAGEVVADVVTGRIDAGHGELQEFLSQLEAGDVQLLVGGLEERTDEYPDVPTTVEKGWDLTLGNFRGMLLKAGTPDDRVERLANLIRDAMETDSYQQFEEESMLHLRESYLPPDEYASFFEENIEVYSDILEE